MEIRKIKQSDIESFAGEIVLIERWQTPRFFLVEKVTSEKLIGVWQAYQTKVEIPFKRLMERYKIPA